MNSSPLRPPPEFPNENRQVYPELVCTAEESATTHLRRKHRAHGGVGTISGEKTGRLSSSEIVMRSWRQADTKRGVPCDCLGEQIWHHIPAVNGKAGKEEGVSH